MKHLKYVIGFYILLNSAFAQNINMQTMQDFDFGQDNRELAQKFRMAAYLLNSPVKQRIESSDNPEARELMFKAETSFSFARGKAKNKNWLEANAVIDSVLRDMTASSQLLSQVSISQNIYEETLKRVEAFTYPYWKNLSQSDQAMLDQTNTQIEELMSKASDKAKQQAYDEASNLLTMAYGLKSQLIQQLDHDSTVVYDLIFDSPDEEFNYLVKRKDHYKGLVDEVLARNTFEEHTLILVNVYIDKSKDGITEADEMKKNGKHKKASQIMERSIKDLATALKILGVKI